MLQELSMVEQRYQAVREVLDSGATVIDVATRFGVDRRTLHRWLVRYANGGLAALTDRSSRPDRCPHQMPADVEAKIVAMRRANMGWGPRTLGNRLRREGIDAPSRSAIHRCLVRHHLIDPKPRRRRREDYKRWERARAMELWQLDVMGGVVLTDGTQLSIVTGIDDHSRFCVMASLVVRATANPVCDAFLSALSTHGIPDQVLTDNGKVFTSRGPDRPSRVLFDRICTDNGIRHLLTAPYSPTTTGKIERLHKTIRREFLAGQAFATLEAAQNALDAWVSDYNLNREHQGIGDVAPIRRFELARAVRLDVVDGEAAPEPPSVPVPSVSRRVDDKGRIAILKHRYHVGRFLAGRSVTVTSFDGLLTVTHDGTVVATHARRHAPHEDDRLDRRKAVTPAKPTRGDVVMRSVGTNGAVSYAGTMYRAGNRYIGQTAGVRLVDDTVQITVDGILVRTHKARHDRTKEYGAMSFAHGKPRRRNADGVA